MSSMMQMKKEMKVKMMSNIIKALKNIGKKIYLLIDKIIVTPVSTLIFKVQNRLGKESKLEKILNRPNFLLFLSTFILHQKSNYPCHLNNCLLYISYNLRLFFLINFSLFNCNKDLHLEID